MPLSTEAILTLLSVLINLVPVLIIVWRYYSQRRCRDIDRQGTSGGRWAMDFD